MRISDSKLCQRVDGDPPQVVLLDEESGEEIALDPIELARLEFGVAYFRATGAIPAPAKACEDAGHPPFRLDEAYSAAICVCNTVLYDSTTGEKVGVTR